MIIKAIEVRDSGTFIPAIAIQMNYIGQPFEVTYLMRRCGWSADNRGIILVRMDTGEGNTDPYSWRQSRTMCAVHLWMSDHFDEVPTGGVVDVEYIMGETMSPKVSERFTNPI